MTRHNTKKRRILDIILIIISILLVIGINFCFQLVLVNGDSMNPTYQNNDFLISSKIAYKNHSPQKGDIVIVDGKSKDLDIDIIKRVVATAGDTVEIRKGQLIINNKKVKEDYIDETMNKDMHKMTVKKNTVFIMGDNRNHSIDSRVFGSIPIQDIMGKVIFDLKF
ncbi:signal peptidase I [Coprobacillus cateniformis]|nr:signal peptidase I [Coprobacillus cateniformis]